MTDRRLRVVLSIGMLVLFLASSLALAGDFSLPGKWVSFKPKVKVEFFEDRTLIWEERNDAYYGEWSLLKDGRIKGKVTAMGMPIPFIGKPEGKKLPLRFGSKKMTLHKEPEGGDSVALSDPSSPEGMYQYHCAECHGAQGDGTADNPPLQDKQWTTKEDFQKIAMGLIKGRSPMMVAHGKFLSEGEIEALAVYVDGLSRGKQDSKGASLFLEKACIACHGMDAKGMDALGSADLTDGTWRFNPGGVKSATYTITHGVNDKSDPKTRKAVCPSVKDVLSKEQVLPLIRYVMEMSGCEKPCGE